MSNDHLKKSLTPILLWGLGVGYVISGMYFGWNLGLPKGGSFGMLAATIIVALLYLCFSLSYAELACSIPKAGGAFDYAHRSLGSRWAFIAGMAQMIEFVFAPPAIAFGLGAYLNMLFPTISVLYFAISAYLIFTALNIYGVKAAASFELLITILAVSGLLAFTYFTYDSFSWEQFQENKLPHQWYGAFASLPFAIWFFLGIEGLANVAEESINPQQDIIKGFGSAILTLIAICFMIFFFSIGIKGWDTIVYLPDGSISDSPLPLAMESIYTKNSWKYVLILSVGTCGLVASFHGLLLSSGRAIYEMGKKEYLPSFLGKLSPRFQTPAIALLLNMTIGIIALISGKTADIILIAVFGALTLYIISMVALLRFRTKELQAPRPYKVPLYPITPLIALGLSCVCLLSLIYFNWLIALLYFGILTLSLFIYWLLKNNRQD
jgi:ethanolamine permease